MIIMILLLKIIVITKMIIIITITTTECFVLHIKIKLGLSIDRIDRTMRVQQSYP